MRRERERERTRRTRNEQAVAPVEPPPEAQHRLGRAEDHVLEPLSEAERTRFRRLLRRLAVRAQDLDPVADACALVEELDGPRPAHTRS